MEIELRAYLASSVDGGDSSSPPSGRLSLGETVLDTPRLGDLSMCHRRSGRCTDKIIPPSLLGIKPRILGRPAQSLHAIPTELSWLLIRNKNLFFNVTLILQNHFL
jgi:hypothetical protein